MTIAHRTLRLSLTYIIASLLLAGMFVLAVTSSRDESPVLSEGQNIARGWVALHTGRLLSTGHPPLSSLIAGLGASLELAAPPPGSIQALSGGALPPMERSALDRLLFLSRLPMVFLGLMLAALIFRWGREVYGLWSGLIALGIVCFSPTIIAYSQLATTDIAAAAFSLAALYAWSRFLHHPRRRWLLIAGVALGLALASDFIALPLLITLPAMTLWHVVRRDGSPRLSGGLAALGGLLAIAAIVAWALTLFSLKPGGEGGTLSELGRYFSQAVSSTRPYLRGRFSPAGWWYAHPLLLLVKLTLPEMALLVLACVLITMRGLQHQEWEIIFPVAVQLAWVMILLPSPEIRNLLVALPLIVLFSARTGATALPSFSWRRMVLAGVIAAAHIWASLAAYPYYLAYFNIALGGPENGYQIAAGSNLDWGQSLPGLAKFMHDHNLAQVYLSYYGSADPAVYGIKAVPLPSWPVAGAGADFHPLNPAPGTYAISASTLVGIPPAPFDQNTFGYFLNRRPLAIVGHSIFVFDIPADQSRPGTWVAQCASPHPVESPSVFAALTGATDLHQFYFDCRQSLPIPDGTGWVVIPPGINPVADLGPADFTSRAPDGQVRYQVWRVSQPPAEPASTIASPPVPLPLPIAGLVELIGYQVTSPTVEVGQTVVIREWWRVRQPPPPPVSLLARLIATDSAGAEHDVLSADALGLRAEDWQPGMTLIQQHAFTIPEDVAPGDYWIAVGLYSADSGRRFPVSETGDQVIDRIILQKVTILPKSR